MASTPVARSETFRALIWQPVCNLGGSMLTNHILVQLIIVLLVVQLFGYVFQRIGQQWVIGEIMAGLALGLSLLGAYLPQLEASSLRSCGTSGLLL